MVTFGREDRPDETEIALEKRKDIEEVLNVLEVDLEEKNISPLRRNEILARLRNHTTSLDGLDPLLTKGGVSILCRYGFDETSPTTSRIALRCLCNTLFLAESTRQMFVDGNYPKEATKRMKHAPLLQQSLIQQQNDDPEDELLSARLLFLCTYGTNLDFNLLFKKCHVAEVINANISRHAKLIVSTAGGSLPPLNAVSACNESLKLLYNLTAHYPHQTPCFFESLLPILKMLNNVPIPSPPLQPPILWLINGLVQLDFEDKETRISTRNPLFPPFESNINVDRLARILDLATQAYDIKEIDRYGSPLVQVLLRIAEIAPPSPKAHLRALLLPSNQDREKILGRGDSLPARLLRLSTTPTARNLGQLISALLFELSDKDVKRFVYNVGYGFAAGFLLSKGVQLPSSASEAWRTGDIDGGDLDRSRDGSKTEEVEIDSKGEEGNIEKSTKAGTKSFEVNPVTGQRRDLEPKIQVPEMTDEDKEREAERLFVLFERMRATGVIDVENPVAQAVREGRFEEVD